MGKPKGPGRPLGVPSSTGAEAPPTLPSVKRCRKCGEVKPRDQYCRHGMSPDGLRPTCNDCERERRQRERDRARAGGNTSYTYAPHFLSTNLVAAIRERNPVPEGWEREGACRSMDPDLWFPELRQPAQADDLRVYQATTRTAIAVCQTCPVLQTCLTFGLGEAYGIWGGTTPPQRHAIRKQMGFHQRRGA